MDSVGATTTTLRLQYLPMLMIRLLQGKTKLACLPRCERKQELDLIFISPDRYSQATAGKSGQAGGIVHGAMPSPRASLLQASSKFLDEDQTGSVCGYLA
ncbi:hypothetical protein D9M70_541010 [compost metagenome]